MREEPNDLKAVPDDDLLRRLFDLLKSSRRVEADLVAHIAEVDARRLFAREATPSMFIYCTERLHLSEPEAALRIRVARASRKHRMLLTMLREGRIHLSGIALLAPLLTQKNSLALLKRATHKSKREIQEIVAELTPRPDVSASVRRLPDRSVSLAERADASLRPDAAASRSPASALPAINEQCPQTSGAPTPDAATDEGLRGSGLGMGVSPERRPDTVVAVSHSRTTVSSLEQRPDAVVTVSPCLVEASRPGVCPDTVVGGQAASDPRLGSPWPGQHPATPATIEPLAPARYSVRFTASAELREKLERLRALMRPSVPDGDLAKVIDVAVTRQLERLEAKRFGKTKRPRTRVSTADTRAKGRYIPAAVRRFVEKRDGGRCTYRDRQGRRCTRRHDLEFHHVKPFGRGGDHSPEGLALMCKTHNALLAEKDFGREKVARHRRRARPHFGPMTVHGASSLPSATKALGERIGCVAAAQVPGPAPPP